VIYSDKWAFIHIPRNAGTNFKSNLSQKSGVYYPTGISDWNTSQHYPIQTWIDLGYATKDSQFIAIVRNPFSRAVSIFEHLNLKRNTRRWLSNFPTDFSSFVKSDRIEWQTKRKQEIRNRIARPTSTDPQHLYIEGDFNVRVFRLEDELDEMEFFVKHRFAHTNYNVGNNPPWETYYTEELKNIIYNKYKKDFDLFGYTND